MLAVLVIIAFVSACTFYIAALLRSVRKDLESICETLSKTGYTRPQDRIGYASQHRPLLVGGWEAEDVGPREPSICDSIDGQERIRFDEFNLTEREGEVLHYLLLGKDARTIGDSLTVSVSTVKSHIYNIYRKLGVHSQREAIAMFEARGLACQLRTS